LKQHKPWFDEEGSRFLDQSRQAKTQWLQDPDQSSANNLNNLRREDSKYFGKKEGTSKLT